MKFGCARWTRTANSGIGLALAALLWTGFLGTATDANAGLLSYDLRIGETKGLVSDPSNPLNQLEASNLTQHELLSARDMPYIQITNNSTEGVTGEIARFTMTIGDLWQNNHHFDLVNMIEVSPGVTWSLNLPDSVQGGVRADAIDISFTGLTRGKFARFRTDIDNDTGNIDMFTDYRTVLFDMNGTSATDNAYVTVTFKDPPFPNQSVANFLPDFNLVGSTITGVGFTNCCFSDTTPGFGGGGGTPQIPEPSTVVLLGLGALGLGVLRRRKLVR